MLKERIGKTINKFREIYGDSNIRVVCAPGRVNLIGEHTDYNDGFVFPVAIDRNILMAFSEREDNFIYLHSLNFNQQSIFSLDDISFEENARWSNYTRGVTHFLKKEGYKLKGMNALIEGNIPIGSGLSSSAALEVASALAFKTINNLEIENTKMALLCQRAENEFVGMKCGIMDQFISILGKKDNALFLDCRNLNYELITLNLKSKKFIIVNTKVKRGLVDSEYNIRRRECEEGVKILKNFIPEIKALRDVTSENFEKYKDNLPENVKKRCKHVIYENERVLDSIEALKVNDFKKFGKYMYESHLSLKENYEVSCKELDLIVKTAMNTKGGYGSRMTGAGFGGCTVSLLDISSEEEFIEKISNEYKAKFGLFPEIIPVSIEDGAKLINHQ
ncbi:MAG: galactokinase [Acidobacteriota bacterium]